MTEIDQIDRQILNALQAKPRSNAQELANRCGVSVSSCYRRLKRLREDNVLIGNVLLVDPKFSPRPVTVIFEVVLERQERGRQSSFKKKAGDSEMVTQCYLVAGEIDYIMVAHFADLEEYYGFIGSFLMEDENIRNFRNCSPWCVGLTRGLVGCGAGLASLTRCGDDAAA